MPGPDALVRTADPAVTPVRTACPYCGVGCGVLATPGGTGGARIAGDPGHPANAGRLCSKGSALGETLSLEERLLHPEIDGERVSWDAALDAVARGFADAVAKHGPDSVAFYVSGQLLTEDYYAANKLIKGWLGTANIDTNSRLCMASSVAGHRRAFGADTVPGVYADLEAADLIVLVGSNLAWCHPILFQRIAAEKARRPALRVVNVDPRVTATSDLADLQLSLAPGSDVALFNGLLVDLHRRGIVDRGYVETHTHGLDDALATARATTPDVRTTAALCGLPPLDVSRFFDWTAAAPRTVTIYSQGVNQSSAGTDKVNAIVNAHLLTGRIGKPGSGPFSVTGQPNAMGGREVGALSNQLAAHLDPGNATHRDLVQRFWRSPTMCRGPGLKAVDLVRAVERGEIKALWVMATNPAVSLPDARRMRRALARCPLLVVSDASARTDTMDLARIRLPALAWGEKDGTVTNSERRISRQRPFLPAPGDARQDWWIVSQVANRLGGGPGFAWRGPADIFREHAALSGFENGGSRDFDISALATITDADYEAMSPTLWPQPAGSAVARERFFADGGFYHPDRRGRFVAVAPQPPAHAPEPAYPFLLNTGRVRDQWHTMTRTGLAARLGAHRPEPTLSLHPADASALGLDAGAFAEVVSRWGRARMRVRLDDAQRRGEAFAPMHWTAQFSSAARINDTVNPAIDPVSGQPELKHTPVRIEPWRPLWSGFAMTRRRLDAPADWWTARRADACWIYELAGADRPVEAWRALRASFEPGRGDVVEYTDAARGRYRGAVLDGDQLEACIFLGPGSDAASRDWLENLFAADSLDVDQRRALLAGRPPGRAMDDGPTVCVCHGVRRGKIERAIRKDGCADVDAVGRACRAGTNCGSCKPEIAALLANARAALEPAR